jgi:hypothetical protein
MRLTYCSKILFAGEFLVSLVRVKFELGFLKHLGLKMIFFNFSRSFHILCSDRLISAKTTKGICLLIGPMAKRSKTDVKIIKYRKKEETYPFMTPASG